MNLLCLGVSHHSSTLELREPLNFSPDELKAALTRYRSEKTSHGHPVSELVVLSTCNRLELYAAIYGPDKAHVNGSDPFQPLIDFLAMTRDIFPEDFTGSLYRYQGIDAVRHLCRVAAGLDSMVVGEHQILGQVTQAYETALSLGSSGRVLSSLFQAAIHTGKRSRTETGIGRNPASISSVAVHFAEQIVHDLRDQRILVLGAGKMGELAVEALRKRGAGQVVVINRTQDRAVKLAERWGGTALSFSEISRGLEEADIVIASTAANHAIISPTLVEEVMSRRGGKPIVFIDIAIPRNIDPAVSAIPGAHVFDLDDLQSQVNGFLASRELEIPRVEAIVEEEVSSFAEWLHVIPIIGELHKRAEMIRRREVERSLRYLPDDLDPAALEHIQHLSRSLVTKLLHEPTLRLKSEVNRGHLVEYARVLADLFGLELDPSYLPESEIEWES